jgi:hypothetical protein
VVGDRPLQLDGEPVSQQDVELRPVQDVVGRQVEARSALSTALQLFSSMEMMVWLTRAEAELAKTE